MSIASPPDTCPRCGRGFRCGMNDPTPCPCTTITLTVEQLAELRRRCTGCLCLDCLRALAAEGPQPAPG